jgi:hypothetical protein
MMYPLLLYPKIGMVSDTIPITAFIVHGVITIDWYRWYLQRPTVHRCP